MGKIVASCFSVFAISFFALPAVSFLLYFFFFARCLSSSYIPVCKFNQSYEYETPHRGCGMAAFPKRQYCYLYVKVLGCWLVFFFRLHSTLCSILHRNPAGNKAKICLIFIGPREGKKSSLVQIFNIELCQHMYKRGFTVYECTSLSHRIRIRKRLNCMRAENSLSILRPCFFLDFPCSALPSRNMVLYESV